MIVDNNYIIGIIGLGYVGLPLAFEFSKKYQVVGFDIDESRIAALSSGTDWTNELKDHEVQSAVNLQFTSSAKKLTHCNTYIVTVPTPVTDAHSPNLSPLIAACEIVAKVLKQGDTVVFESTVFPGCTEEICIPLLRNRSALLADTDFMFGYSPERVDPGKGKKKLKDIVKVVSGNSLLAVERIDALYSSIIRAGTYITSSIRVAEAAKVIENTQRDLNIALVNELSKIFDLMNINTSEVIDAAASKWNFMPFRPGLVGGHCIGVDPYYLTYKSEALGYYPEIILAGRRMNESMADFIAVKLVKRMINEGYTVKDSNVLLMGVTFKEDCPDTRNSKVFNLIDALAGFGINVDVYDPWVMELNFENKACNQISSVEPKKLYHAAVIAVSHQKFLEFGTQKIRSNLIPNGIIFDVKSVFPCAEVDLQL
ncbi:nucleotide sugar dehydrogenase [Alphaproteobacteria bacterium]|nr:nucleotide sugar dehydrogenase [Alphaproteobacteria bacterium]